MEKKYTDEINWRRLFKFSVSCVMILILLFAGPINYYNLRNIQLDGGILEDVYRVSGRGGSNPKLVLTVEGKEYQIQEACVEDDLKNLEAILGRRIGEHVYLRYTEDFLKRQTIVELDYMGFKLVDYDYAMANRERVLKENAYVSVAVGLIYILMLVVLKCWPNLLKH